MMRKRVFLLLIGGLLGITCHGFSFSLENDDGTPSSPLSKGDIRDTSVSRPRAPRRPCSFWVAYDLGQQALIVSSLSNVGRVKAVIENLSTGALCAYSFDSSGPAVLPISGEPGLWEVSIYTFNKQMIWQTCFEI